LIEGVLQQDNCSHFLSPDPENRDGDPHGEFGKAFKIEATRQVAREILKLPVVRLVALVS
jgi:hypothetical protein